MLTCSCAHSAICAVAAAIEEAASAAAVLAAGTGAEARMVLPAPPAAAAAAAADCMLASCCCTWAKWRSAAAAALLHRSASSLAAYTSTPSEKLLLGPVRSAIVHEARCTWLVVEGTCIMEWPACCPVNGAHSQPTCHGTSGYIHCVGSAPSSPNLLAPAFAVGSTCA
jgi:hypothetical protein